MGPTATLAEGRPAPSPAADPAALSPEQATAGGGGDAGGERELPAGAGADRAKLANPPPPAVKPKKRKRRDASGPTAGGPADVAGAPDCRDLIYGAQARAAIELRPVRFIRLQDVQNLVLWVLGEGSNPSKWAFVRNKALVERVVLVALPGLDAETWRAHRAALPTLGGKLGEPVTLLAQRADVWQSQSVRSLFSVPETRKAKAARNAGPPPAPAPPPHPPPFYRLTPDQLKMCEFPLLGADGAPPEGYIATQPRPAAASSSPPSSHHALVALDCEMCETAAGFEVTRVSLVDADGAVLLDELVRPAAPIIEYHTRYSGITAAMLEGVTTTLEDVQATILAHCSADTLLVGHGLENDLRALRIAHASIVDTSVLYPHPRGLPSRTALRRLASTFLKKAIQAGEHDSVEDARVALALARLKFKHGPGWGVDAPDKGEKLCVVLEAAGRAASLVDRPEVLNRLVAGRANALPAQTDREAAVKASREACAPGIHFVWTQLGGLDALQRARAEARRAALEVHAQALADRGGEADVGPHPPLHDGGEPGAGPGAGAPPPLAADEAAPDVPPAPPTDAELSTVLADLDAHVARLEAALPSNTLLILATCQGDTHDTRRLQQQAYRRAQGLDGLPPWSPGREAHLDRLRERGMQALCFATVKQ